MRKEEKCPEDEVQAAIMVAKALTDKYEVEKIATGQINEFDATISATESQAPPPVERSRRTGVFVDLNEDGELVPVLPLQRYRVVGRN